MVCVLLMMMAVTVYEVLDVEDTPVGLSELDRVAPNIGRRVLTGN